MVNFFSSKFLFATSAELILLYCAINLLIYSSSLLSHHLRFSQEEVKLNNNLILLRIRHADPICND
jgi:hypothetical protein